MAYPSVNSTPGTAQRNLGPVTEALEPLVSDSIRRSNTSTRTALRKVKPQILELGSGAYTHITSWASKWPEVEWWGSVRDADQLKEVQDLQRPSNLPQPIQLDVQVPEHWLNLERLVKSKNIQFSGIIMLNLIHCMPIRVLEELFKHLSAPSYGRLLLMYDVWIAAYGPWLNDDGSYKSKADQEFEASHVKATDPSLGLRSIASITAIAQRYKFAEERRVEMPAGNVFVIWRKGGAT